MHDEMRPYVKGRADGLMAMRISRRWLSLGACVAVIVLGVLKLFVVDLYTIPQNGMSPTLPRGSKFLALKRPWFDATGLRRGDVIVLKGAPARGSALFVWRVIGLPGDQVEVGAGVVRINGEVLGHLKRRAEGPITIYKETNGEAAYEVAYGNLPSVTTPVTRTTVPNGEVFVLGDNRDSALDSRFEGTIPSRRIIARKIPR